ncbi:MAG: DegT/DnrJ/EryC1/StrS family aminotransferase [Nitrospirota bacterium]
MTTVPLLDLKAQYSTIRPEVGEAIERVLESQHFILGPEVEALEQEIAAFCNARFAVGVSSGTDALLAALMAIGAGPGDEIITSAYSFFATAGVIARLGARPVFADIEPKTFNCDGSAISKKITSRTKAIMPVHLFGQCAETDPIIEHARAKGIRVIEDAAQAIGATHNGRAAGTMGDIGCFSFFPSKNLGAFGDGGMVITDDPALAEKLRIVRVHGAKPKYHHSLVGGNFRLDALQAAILRVKLKYLPRWSEGRRNNAMRYRRLFDESKLTGRVSLPGDSPGHIYNQFIVRVPERDRLREFLKQTGIETEIYYPVPLHLQDCFAELGYQSGDFPCAEAAARDSLALPIYPELSEQQQRHVVNQISYFYH